MTSNKLPAYTYNTTSITKNNRKVDIDIDLICEDLYRCIPDKDRYTQIMDNIKEEIFSEDRDKKTASYTSSMPNSMGLGTAMGNMNQIGTSYNNPMGSYIGSGGVGVGMSSNITGNPNVNVLRFKSTIPDGEMITPGPYQERTQHKKYNDVNANSNYYYPRQENTIHDTTRSQWTNRANRIMYDSQSNWNNNDKRMQSPLSGSQTSIYNNNNNNTMMMGSVIGKQNY